MSSGAEHGWRLGLTQRKEKQSRAHSTGKSHGQRGWPGGKELLNQRPKQKEAVQRVSGLGLRPRYPVNLFPSRGNAAFTESHFSRR